MTGDGRAELAVGAPFGTPYGSPTGVGLFFGSPMGVTDTGAQWWTQTSPGIGDVVDEGDRFGTALAFGDFDDDDHGDLAIGTPNIHIDSAVGKVIVLPGSDAGPTTTGVQIWDSPVQGTDDWGPEFGFSLAPGDFNGDGADDLAIGAPWTGIESRGASTSCTGATVASTTPTPSCGRRTAPGSRARREDDDVFGIAVTALDFDRSGHDDLAIGASNKSGHRPGYGANHRHPGPCQRPRQRRDQGLEPGLEAHQGRRAGLGPLRVDARRLARQARLVSDRRRSPTAAAALGLLAILCVAVPSPSQAATVAAIPSDFDGDGHVDLAIGAPGRSVGAAGRDAGVVNVLYGSADGPSARGDQRWSLDSPGVKGSSHGRANTRDHNGDRYGATLRRPETSTSRRVCRTSRSGSQSADCRRIRGRSGR